MEIYSTAKICCSKPKIKKQKRTQYNYTHREKSTDHMCTAVSMLHNCMHFKGTSSQRKLYFNSDYATNITKCSGRVPSSILCKLSPLFIPQPVACCHICPLRVFKRRKANGTEARFHVCSPETTRSHNRLTRNPLTVLQL